MHYTLIVDSGDIVRAQLAEAYYIRRIIDRNSERRIIVPDKSSYAILQDGSRIVYGHKVKSVALDPTTCERYPGTIQPVIDLVRERLGLDWTDAQVNALARLDLD